MSKDILGNRDFSHEFEFHFSKSGGPGGQHVNKTSSKVELRFDIDNSELLTEEEREMIKERLKNRINNENVLIISSQNTRSQLKNREKAVNKFYELINKALRPRKKRKPTKPSKAAKEKRLKEKHIQSEKKEQRKKPGAG